MQTIPNNNLLNDNDPRSWQLWQFQGSPSESARLSPAWICFWDVLATKLERGSFTVGANLFLSSVYSSSVLSVSPDPILSMRYARRAADRGDTFAMILMGLGHAKGYGVPKDLSLTDHWLKLAMRQGSPLAFEVWADLYLMGDTTPKRQQAALKAYASALDANDIAAVSHEFRHDLTDHLGKFPSMFDRDRVKEKLRHLPGGAAYVAKLDLEEAEAKARHEAQKSHIDSDDRQRREAYQRCEQRVADRYLRGHMNMELCQY